MKCKKDDVDMPLEKWFENDIKVEGNRCPICGLVVYTDDNPELYRKMGMIK